MFLDCLAISKQAPNPEAAYKWLNWILDSFDAGFGADPEDPQEFGLALKNALDANCEWDVSQRFQEFVDFNTEENYQCIWREGLELREGQPYSGSGMLKT